jgi:hypothetical protein
MAATAAPRAGVINNRITGWRGDGGRRQHAASKGPLIKREFNTNSCNFTGSAKPVISGPSLLKEKKATHRN